MHTLAPAVSDLLFHRPSGKFLPRLITELTAVVRTVRGSENGNVPADHLGSWIPVYPPGSGVPIGNGPIERHSNDGVIGEFHDGRHTRQQPVGLGQVSSGARHTVLQLFGKLSHLLPGAPAFDDFLLELSIGRPQPS